MKLAPSGERESVCIDISGIDAIPINDTGAGADLLSAVSYTICGLHLSMASISPGEDSDE
jgi:hypothetical protein